MSNLSFLKYFGAYIFIALGVFSFVSAGILTYSLVLFSFGVIPIIELITSPNEKDNKPKNIKAYNTTLYTLVLLYSYTFYYFLTHIHLESDLFSLIGKISSMGMLMGIFGINMAHELGHRKNEIEQLLAQYLLWTTQYTHFFIEHNRGHHRRVATPEDPATARKDESLYFFWVRTVRDSYKSAWHIENTAIQRQGKKALTWKNQMIRFTFFQIILLFGVALFGVKVLISYILSCILGILLLETINYIEHYGLLRKKINSVAYERVQYHHSWNSDHILGRYLLFELTRHSHHHENSLKQYPELQSKNPSPQLPTGYPGMMILSFIPPLFYWVMNKRIPSISSS